jgi:hypothetical protein
MIFDKNIIDKILDTFLFASYNLILNISYGSGDAGTIIMISITSLLLAMMSRKAIKKLVGEHLSD